MIEYLLILSADKVQIVFLSFILVHWILVSVTIILGLFNTFHYQYLMNHALLKEAIEVYSLFFYGFQLFSFMLINKKRKH